MEIKLSAEINPSASHLNPSRRSSADASVFPLKSQTRQEASQGRLRISSDMDSLSKQLEDVIKLSSSHHKKSPPLSKLAKIPASSFIWSISTYLEREEEKFPVSWRSR